MGGFFLPGVKCFEVGSMGGGSWGYGEMFKRAVLVYRFLSKHCTERQGFRVPSSGFMGGFWSLERSRRPLVQDANVQWQKDFAAGERR